MKKPAENPKYCVKNPAKIGPKISPKLQMKIVQEDTESTSLSLFSKP
jgi:hypothetical protein